MNLSLLQVETRKSYPLITEQLVREEVKESAQKAVKEKPPKRGRPKGSVYFVYDGAFLAKVLVYFQYKSDR